MRPRRSLLELPESFRVAYQGNSMRPRFAAPTVFELVRHRVFSPERAGALDERRAAGVPRADAWHGSC
jgi:hypothetical protein